MPQTVTAAAFPDETGCGEETEVCSMKVTLLTEDQSKSIREALSKLRKDCPVCGVLCTYVCSPRN